MRGPPPLCRQDPDPLPSASVDAGGQAAQGLGWPPGGQHEEATWGPGAGPGRPDKTGAEDEDSRPYLKGTFVSTGTGLTRSQLRPPPPQHRQTTTWPGGRGRVACGEGPTWGSPWVRWEAAADPFLWAAHEGSGRLPTERLLWRGWPARRCLETRSVRRSVPSASAAGPPGGRTPSSHHGALSRPRPKAEVLPLPCGDSQDPGPAAAAQPPALTLSRVHGTPGQHEVKGCLQGTLLKGLWTFCHPVSLEDASLLVPKTGQLPARWEVEHIELSEALRQTSRGSQTRALGGLSPDVLADSS
nr:uncharacterized protein LOC115841469 isoform X2 [Globicephala melas]